MECKEWVWDGGILKEMNASQTKKKIQKLSEQRKLDEKTKLKLFGQYLINL